MTALDDAIEAAKVEVAKKMFDGGNGGRILTDVALRAAVESGYLVPRDDIEGLLKALGAERCDGAWFCHVAQEFAQEKLCPDCRPVYTINPPKPKELTVD